MSWDVSVDLGRVKPWCAAILLAAIAVPNLACHRPDAQAQGQKAPIQWRFAIEEPIGSVQHAYATKFKELIERRSDGQIKVTVYPLGTLGTSDQLTEQLDLGVIQFVMASPGHLGKLIPEVQLFLLHFVFSDDAAVNNRVLNENASLQASFDRIYARKGMKVLSIFSEGWLVWTTKKPIRKPSDFHGVKMRVMTSPLLIAAYNAYGASPTPLPYSEVYSGLQLNMIEGQENPIFAIEEMSFHEVTDYMIFPYHAPFITTAVTNQRFFNGLSDERRHMVEEVVAELSGYILKKQQEFNAKRLKIIKREEPDLKIIHLSDDERELFREKSLTVREQYVELAGAEGGRLLRELLQAIQAAEDASGSEPNEQEPNEQEPGEEEPNRDEPAKEDARGEERSNEKPTND